MISQNKAVSTNMDDSVLEVTDLTKEFGGITAVNDLSFQLQRKELLGLIGPNGAGKTTVFNMITGFHRPTSGSVSLEGTDITNLAPNEVCHAGLARTFQIPKPLADLSVVENVMIGAFAQTDSRAEAKRLAKDVLSNIQFDHEFSIPAGNLPVAGKKKLEVAKALATDPNVLLLDEVLAGLNPAEVDEFLDILSELASELTITMIEHNVDAIMAVSDRVLVMANGQKLALDEPEKVRNNDEVIEAYIGKE